MAVDPACEAEWRRRVTIPPGAMTRRQALRIMARLVESEDAKGRCGAAIVATLRAIAARRP